MARTGRGEYGRTELEILSESLLLQPRRDSDTVWMSHFDSIVAAPDGFRVTARTAEAAVAVLEALGRPDLDLAGARLGGAEGGAAVGPLEPLFPKR